MCDLSRSLLLTTLCTVFFIFAPEKAISEIITPLSITCTCGMDGEPMQVPIKSTCAINIHNENGDARCKHETEKSICILFQFCKTCDVEKRQCTTCPAGRYGRRCWITLNSFFTSKLYTAHRPEKTESEAPWISLLLGDLASQTYSQSWGTEGNTPSGLVNFEYTATYSIDAPPEITVITQTQAGEGKNFSYNHPLTESWFKEKFGEDVAIPEDVKILNEDEESYESVPTPNDTLFLPELPAVRQLVKRGSDAPWKSLLLGDLAGKTYMQSWRTGGDTPSGLVTYSYTGTYSIDQPPQITVIAQTKAGEKRQFTYNQPLTESWFKEKFGSEVPIPEDVMILNNGQGSPQTITASKDTPLFRSGLYSPVASKAPDTPWNRLLLGGLAGKTYSQSWMTGGDTPSGLVSYSYTGSYSQSALPEITVIALTRSGEERKFTYNHPLTESWFRERFGDRTAIPEDVRILNSEQPQTVHPTLPQGEKIPNNQHVAAIPQATPDILAILGDSESKTFRKWWYSGGPESSRGYVGYNYTAVYSRSSPTKVTVVAINKKGEKTTFNSDKTPSDSWFKEMFGETVSIPNEAFRTAEKPSAPVKPSFPQEMCPPLVSGDDPSAVGTKKTYHCQDDYWRQVGPSTITCQPNGQWSAKPPTCIPKVDTPAGQSVCLLPSLSKQVSIKWSNLDAGLVVAGTTLRLSCEDRYLYDLQGSDVLVCNQDGTWRGQTPTCIPKKYDDPGCGREVKVEPTINGGVSVPNSRPWMIHITAVHQANESSCGGSLIQKQWVLTAAHCLLIDTRTASRIILYLDKTGERIVVERFVIHPQYTTGYLDYDVALLRLTRPVTRVGILPICLPAPNQDVQPGDTGIVMGRGYTANLNHPKMLQKASLTVVTNEQCRKWLAGEITVQPTDRMYCALGTKGLESVCLGDSGGPMVFQKASESNVWTQYGIISWAPKAACNTTEVQYSGLVRISAVLSWIRQQMSLNV